MFTVEIFVIIKYLTKEWLGTLYYMHSIKLHADFKSKDYTGCRIVNGNNSMGLVCDTMRGKIIYPI